MIALALPPADIIMCTLYYNKAHAVLMLLLLNIASYGRCMDHTSINRLINALEKFQKALDSATTQLTMPQPANKVPSLKKLVITWLDTNGHTITSPQNLSPESVAHLAHYVSTCSTKQKNAIVNNMLSARGGTPAYHTWKRFILAALLHAHADPNVMSRCGKTFLYQAALHDDHEAIKLLFAYDANPNTDEHAAFLPLAHIKTAEIAQLFFDHGQTIRAFDTVFPYLAWHQYEPELITIYKKQGADLRRKHTGDTLLHLLARQIDWHYDHRKLVTKVRLLLHEAPDLLTTMNTNGKTAAAVCQEYSSRALSDWETRGHQTFLAVLNEYDTQAPSEPHNDFHLPHFFYQLACYECHPDWIQRGIQKKMNVRQLDESGCNILHRLCKIIAQQHPPENLNKVRDSILKKAAYVLDAAPDLLTFKPLARFEDWRYTEPIYQESPLELCKRLLREAKNREKEGCQALLNFFERYEAKATT